MYYFSLVYFVNQPLHASVIFYPNPANRQSTKKHNTYQLLYIYTVYLLMMDYKYAQNM
jgi:hypothetical protein